MITKNRAVVFLSGVVFVLCMVVGFGQAQKKPLWNDEIYSQIANIEGLSFRAIIAGGVREGNVAPAFYLIQKFVCQVFDYHSPSVWAGGGSSWDIDRPQDRIVLRIAPNFFMSLGIAVIFLYFSRFYSLGVGLYALATGLTTFMVWAYWVEARHYSLWFFLTTLQSLLFLFSARQEKISRGIWIGITLTHIALAFSVVFSLVQMGIVSLLLFAREKDWRKYILLTLIPLVIAGFYCFHTPKYNFWFKEGAVQLLSASIAKERMLLMGIYATGYLLFFLQRRMRGFRVFCESFSPEGKGYLLLSLLTLVVAAAALLVLKFREGGAMSGFQISNRYFMFLAPLGIIGTVIYSVDLLRLLRGRRWVQIGFGAVLGLILVFRIYKTFGIFG